MVNQSFKGPDGNDIIVPEGTLKLIETDNTVTILSALKLASTKDECIDAIKATLKEHDFKYDNSSYRHKLSKGDKDFVYPTAFGNVTFDMAVNRVIQWNRVA
jgi:hypothetical protein